MHQLLFLDGKGWLVFVGIVDVALQVYHVAQGGKGYVAKNPPHVLQVTVLARGTVLTLVIVDGCVEVTDAFLDTCHVDFLVHLQHVLKEF